MKYKLIRIIMILFLCLVLAPSKVIGATASTTFTVQTNLVPACTVSATNLDFGNIVIGGGLTTNMNGSVSVTCSSGISYSIGLNTGLYWHNGTPLDIRQLRKATGEFGAYYWLYRDSSKTQEWLDASPNLLTGTGNGSLQTHTVFGSASEGAEGAPPGLYSDTITVTVTY